jgi:hypothetical protein
MAIMTEIFTLSKAYPIISIIIAVILFFIGLKVATKLIRWVLWILAVIAVIATVYMLFA